MGSKTLVQTHLGSCLGRADTTSCFSLPHSPSHAGAHRQAACPNSHDIEEVCLATSALAPGESTIVGQVPWAVGSGRSYPFLSRAFHQGRWLSSRMKYSSPFCSCRSCAFIGR